MAKIQEETIVITVSKLHKTTDSSEQPITTEDILSALESVAEELFGDSVVVEITKS